MDFNSYQEFVISKMNPETLKTKEGMLMNGILGLCGETGETADLVKKWAYHSHDLDLVKIKKELGDIQFYVALCSSAIDELLEDVAQANVDKLSVRYNSGFTVEESKAKKDQDV